MAAAMRATFKAPYAVLECLTEGGEWEPVLVGNDELVELMAEDLADSGVTTRLTVVSEDGSALEVQA